MAMRFDLSYQLTWEAVLFLSARVVKGFTGSQDDLFIWLPPASPLGIPPGGRVYGYV